MSDKIPEKYMKIINRIREIYTETGSKLFYKSEDYGGFNQYHGSKDGQCGIMMYWDAVHELKTPEGSNPVLGSRRCGDDQKAFDMIKEEFGLEYSHSPEGFSGEKWDYYIITKMPV
jgi:hypothetical protein